MERERVRFGISTLKTIKEKRDLYVKMNTGNFIFLCLLVYIYISIFNKYKSWKMLPTVVSDRKVYVQVDTFEKCTYYKKLKKFHCNN